MWRVSCISLAWFAFATGPSAAADGPFAFWPGAEYDSRVPTIGSVLGYAAGEDIYSHAQIGEYMHALADAAPDRMVVEEYARTWEGRALIFAIIGSPENIAALKDGSLPLDALRDLRSTTDRRAEELIKRLPVKVWLGYGVHGDEISSPDAAMFTAYHLLASTNDPVVDTIFENALVFIDPLQNPDGRERFLHNFRENRGLEADPSVLAAEHLQLWPGGRTNHYLFDMNRDWFAVTQPETRGRITAMKRYLPHVNVDLHEMGANSTYYFAPPAVPHNPYIVPSQIKGLEHIGRNNAKWFDKFGFDYFTREVYDFFYPGYGDSWPAFFGALSSTYEMASAEGLLIERDDGSLLRFRDGVQRHFVASISTAEAAAARREGILREFWEYNKSAVEGGRRGDVRSYVLPRTGDYSAVDKLAQILAFQGVEVRRTRKDAKECGVDLPAGSYVIDLAQPAYRLVRTLFDPNVPMAKAFTEEQERRRAKNLPDEIYDVTAWSLPLMYNVACEPCGREVRTESEPVAGGPDAVVPRAIPEAPDAVAYIAPWGTSAAGRLLTGALRWDMTVLSSDKSFTLNGREFSRGSLIFKVSDNSKGLRDELVMLARETGAEVVASDTTWVDSGVNFGSDYVVRMRAPRIALAWGAPTDPSSAGQTRFVLERQFGYPVTVVRTKDLDTPELDRFHVLILPSAGTGTYAEVLGEDGAERLKDWVEAGGVLITLDSAPAYAALPGVGLLDVDEEYLAKEGEEKKEDKKDEDEVEEKDAQVEGELLKSEKEYVSEIEPKKQSPDSLAGVLVRAESDPDHWLTAGVADSVNVLVRGRRIFTPITLDKGVNAVRFAGPDELVASGHMWEENRKQLAFKPFVVEQDHGRGMVIGFTADPNVRAYMDGLNVLFLNSVFRAAAHARPVFRD